MTTTYTTALALFIDGKWRQDEGRDHHPVINPATGETLAQLPMATAADLDEALAATAKGFAVWRKTDVNDRAGILHKVAGLIRERAETIAVLLTTEQGKPLAEARVEVLSCAAQFDYFAEEAKRSYGRVLVRPTGQRVLVLKQPSARLRHFPRGISRST